MKGDDNTPFSIPPVTLYVESETDNRLDTSAGFLKKKTTQTGCQDRVGKQKEFFIDERSGYQQ